MKQINKRLFLFVACSYIISLIVNFYFELTKYESILQPVASFIFCLSLFVYMVNVYKQKSCNSSFYICVFLLLNFFSNRQYLQFLYNEINEIHYINLVFIIPYEGVGQLFSINSITFTKCFTEICFCLLLFWTFYTSLLIIKKANKKRKSN